MKRKLRRDYGYFAGFGWGVGGFSAADDLPGAPAGMGAPVTGTRFININLCNDQSAGACFASGVQGVSINNSLFRTTFTVPSGVDLSQWPWFLEVQVGVTAGALNSMGSARAVNRLALRRFRGAGSGGAVL